MKRVITSFFIAVCVCVGLAALALIFGGPSAPPPMESITEPFQSVDYSDLPEVSYYEARDGARLAYRHYPTGDAQPKGAVVLLHGSGASSRSMHTLAKAFAAADYSAYALDVRGHGASAMQGDIDYVGQLEDDLADFMHVVEPAAPTVLVGFSSGGGFALRFAGSRRQELFGGYLLLSPFISQDAANQRPGSGGWVDLGLPRYIAILMLNRIGIHVFDHMTVMHFALAADAPDFLTPTYSFNLARNYRPKPDYLATIRRVHQPISVVAGLADEAFRTERLPDVFEAAGKDVPVTLLPHVGHVELTLDAKAIKAEINAVNALVFRVP